MRHIRMAIAAAAGLAALEAASPDDSSLSESARIDRTMVYIREHNQDLGFEGPGEVDPAATAKQGGPAGRYPAAPYLLVGVRDSKGYRSYVSPVSGTRTSAAVNV